MKKPFKPYRFIYREDLNRLFFKEFIFSIKEIDRNFFFEIEEPIKAPYGPVYIFKYGKLDNSNNRYIGKKEDFPIIEALMTHINHYKDFYSNLIKSEISINKYNL